MKDQNNYFPKKYESKSLSFIVDDVKNTNKTNAFIVINDEETYYFELENES